MQSRRQVVTIVSLTMLFLFTMKVRAVYAQPQSVADKLYELRIYSTDPGKLAAFQTFFKTRALPLFAKYGIENVFDGTVLEGAREDGSNADNMLVCILTHQSRAAAEGAWAALDNDKEWRSAWKGAEQDGSLLARPAISIFMSPTDFSPTVAPPAKVFEKRIFELRKYNTGREGLPRTVEQFRSGLAAILSKNGMTPIAYWTADDRSAFIYLLAHKDREAARTSWASFMTDFRPFMAEFNARSGAPPAGTRRPDDNRFLIPTDFSPIK